MVLSVLEERFLGQVGGAVDSLVELEGELRRTKAQILALEGVVYSGSVDGVDLWGESQRGVVESRVESPEALQLHRKQQHFGRLLGMALKFGLEERKVELAEREAGLLQEAFAAAMAELGVDALSGRLVLSRHLDALEVGVVEGDVVREGLVAGVPDPVVGFGGLEGVGVRGRGPDMELGVLVGSVKEESASRRFVGPDVEDGVRVAEELRALDREWLEVNDRRRALGLPVLKGRDSMRRVKERVEGPDEGV